MARIAASWLNVNIEIADTLRMGVFITVSDAAGRVLFRRPATEEEVMSAIAAAQAAEAEGQAAMQRIAQERLALETTEGEAR